MGETKDETDEEPTAKQNLSRGLLAQLWDTKTVSGADAVGGRGEVIRRATVSFVVDGASCAPGFFVDEAGEFFDVRITLRALSSADELEALEGVRSPSSAPLMLAKAALYALNDEPLNSDQRDWLWEGLGMGGRQLCFFAFNQIGSAAAGALGKFRKTSSIG